MRFFLALISLALVASSAPVWASGDTELDVGGQIRFRPEMQTNKNFDSDNNQDQRFTGQRIRLNVKGTNENVTSFLQIQDSRLLGDVSNTSSAAEVEALDIYQAWFQINELAGAPLTLKMGRQTLVYGSQRLLGHLGWKDNARSFDAMKLTVKAGPGKVDLISAKLAEDGYPAGYEYGAANSGTFSTDENLTGAYGMFDVGGQKVDVYYLIHSKLENYAVNTMGGRLAGKAGAIDYTAEYVIQSGDESATVSREANALAVEAGYNMGPTRIGFLYASGSGDDDTTDATNKDFVFPFHTNHAHYGYMDYFSWGNMNDIALRFKTKFMEKNVLKVDYHMLSLAEAKGNWLDVVGNTKGGGWDANPAYTETAAGSELDITVVHPYSANMKCVIGYSTFSPGAAVKERIGTEDAASWGYVMLINNF